MWKRSKAWIGTVRRSKLASERGASLVEYALMVALIAVVCIGAVTFLGTSTSGKTDKAGKAIAGRELVGCSVFAPGTVYYYYDDGTSETVSASDCPEIP